MTDRELIDWCGEVAKDNRFIRFPEEILSDIDMGQAELISKHFGRSTLMYLPASEVKFFEWLKQADNPVWEDLWGSDEEEPYVVGVSFLPVLMDKMRGFPICDLISTDNYYFSEAHFASEESKILLDSVKERFLAKEKLSLAQMLVLEISLAPIDIWHFAYKFGVPVEAVKDTVEHLVEDKILVHFKNAEQLAGFIEF